MKAQRSKRTWVAVLSVSVVFSVIAVYAAIAGVPESRLRLTRTTIDGGGTMEARSDRFTLRGTIGQPDAGRLSYRTLMLNGGFWFPLQPGDCEEDGDVDEREYAQFNTCLSGPSVLVPRDCECFDLNRSGRIELRDFSLLQVSYTGP